MIMSVEDALIALFIWINKQEVLWSQKRVYMPSLFTFNLG